jgi:hypothetical protein
LSLETLESRKDDVLNETVAQDIFRELKDLRAYVQTHGKRWILELIQNALDVAKEQGVDVRIDFDGSRLLFSHNGRSFNEEELIHLIYHGSTKVESKGSSGKLGTGFLASHLLSSQVRVRGTLCDKQVFDFTLDRQAESIEELTAKMKTTWDQLRKSMRPVASNTQTFTSYEYSVDTPEKISIYRRGVDILRESAPILLGLDKRLKSVTMREGDEEIVWSKKEKPNSHRVDISLVHDGKISELDVCSVVVVSDNDTSVAVPLTLKNGKLALFNASNLPKLYYPLPLIGSTAFPFPVLISNRDFVPTPDREGALLTSVIGEREVARNRQIVEKAFELFSQVIDLICETGFIELHNIARLPTLEETKNKCSKWLDGMWIEPMARNLIEKIRKTPVLMTTNGLLSPKDSRIPVFAGHTENVKARENLKKLWELAAKEFPKSTPTEESYEGWQDILSGWLTYRAPAEEPEPYVELLTIEKLCQIVEEKGNLDDLQSSLNGVPVITWLNGLLALVQAAKKDLLFETVSILPNQNRVFSTREGMYCDAGISENLKDIASMLGRDVRKELLMTEIVTSALTNSRTEQEIRLDTLRRIKDQAKTDYQRENYLKANVKLFQWLVDNKRFEDIRDSFPIFSRGKEVGEEQYLYSFTEENRFLVPEAALSGEDRKYIDVFPQRAILSNIYSSLTPDKWKELAEKNLVFQKLWFVQSMALNNKQLRILSLDEIPENDTKDHKSNEKIQVTSVPFLEDKDWGVMDRLSGRERAAKFLCFILGNLIKSDTSWKEVKEVGCSCDSTHHVYPSIWLEALRTRQWVPVSGGKGEKPSSENLAQLFVQNELMGFLNLDDARQFLGILGVNVSVLMTANKSSEERRRFDQAFSKLLTATSMNPEQLTQLADAYSDQDLRKKLLDAVAEKKLVRGNQKVGKLVETLIRKLIEDELPKDIYKVDKVRTGSDASIALVGEVEPSNDYLDSEGRELFLRIRGVKKEHLVEIKSARTNIVRMTVPQARQAYDASSAFTLCVVEVPADILDMSDEQAATIVMQNSRFVFPIGEKLGDMIREVDAFQSGEKQLVDQQNQDMQVDIISDVQIRIRVNQPVWQKGLDFTAFVQLIGGKQPVARGSQI